jgi:phosphoenolpyruvate carboxylase
MKKRIDNRYDNQIKMLLNTLDAIANDQIMAMPGRLNKKAQRGKVGYSQEQADTSRISF